MKQNPLTARQRMDLRLSRLHRYQLSARAKVSASRKMLQSAAQMLLQAQSDLDRGEIVDLDLPDTIQHLQELIDRLADTERHADTIINQHKGDL